MTIDVAKLIVDVQELMGEVSGAGTQTYSEDVILGHIRRGFNMVFTKWSWPQYRGHYQDALDGVDGKVSTHDLLIGIKDFADVIACYIDGSPVALPTLPKGINPFTITGTKARFYTSLAYNDTDFAGKLIEFWPRASTDVVNISAKLYPVDEWSSEVVLDIDRDLLAYAGAAMALSADDLNPGGAELYRVMMESRYKDIMANHAAQPIPISGHSGIPMDWSAAP